MDLATFHPVFLFLGVFQAVVAHVEPPINATLHCHNLHNVLNWSYDQLSPGLRFRINILATSSLNGAPDVVWVDPPAELQADLSFLSDPSNVYHLTVTAVMGQNESIPAPHDGIIFSYFKDSLDGQICFVDFPPVNVTAQPDNTVLVRFTHPWLVYRHKLQRSKNTNPRSRKSNDAPLPIFHYDVMTTNQHYRWQCVDSVCEEKLPVDAAQKKHCLTMSGEMKKISVQGTQPYCVHPVEESPSYIVHICVVGTLLFGSAVAFVLFMVYRKKTMPLTSIPNSMTFKSKVKQWTGGPGLIQETVSVPEVEATSPTPLLPTEENEFTATVTSSTEPELRLPIGVSTEDEGVSDDVEVGNDEGPGYMPGSNFDEDEAPSGYESRPVLVEFAPGELAEGYRG
ncbi:interferon gamma receptor 1-like isoform X2 [Perca fluviatilis]|uniref:interferon gamma receptor 1-like isoform X2 n=1 Tax=Perca fluviatilis TaxID=8168 RepID=UPI0019665BEB|nr:interferon gamma receptor 1-like isoform X2 [Perca fluviatilis]